MRRVENNSKNGETSTSLIDRARLNDEHAWAVLTELYGPLIYYWARKAGLSAEDAADMLQDVFCSLHARIGDFKKTMPSGSFRAWLWTITRNRIRDHYKCQQGKAAGIGGTTAHLHLLNVPEHAEIDDSDSAVMFADGVTKSALAIVRGEVQEVTWKAFWRTTIDNMSPAVVAEELGLSVASIYQAKSRVLRRLRGVMDDDDE